MTSALRKLSVNPRPSGCKKIKGRDAWRIRVGDYRAIYEIEDGKLIIRIISIGHRKDVYE
jgi:mRNA interferase RelE/StbE